MDALHIAAFLRCMDEPEMAEEVESMANRLEAFAEGLDRDCLEAAVAAEREICARICDDWHEIHKIHNNHGAVLARLIRERSNAEITGRTKA